MKTDQAHPPVIRTLPHPDPDERERCRLATLEPRHDFLLALFAPPAITTEAGGRPTFGRRHKFRTGDFP